jgi:lipopolysaccharide biosynthesis regulator YciM
MKLVYFIISSLMFLACGGSSPQIKSSSTPSETSPKIKKEKPQRLRVVFQNKSGTVIYDLDPTAEDIFIDFTGSAELNAPAEKQVPKEQKQASKDIVPPGSDWVHKDSLPNAPKPASPDTLNIRVMEALTQAQKAFYKKDYEKAIKLAEKSLTVQETPEAYALLGSIHYVNKHRKKAIKNWNRALDMNPNMESVKKILAKLKGTP